MGKCRRKPASPQSLFPLHSHMNWDAGADCRPGPAPTAWGSDLTEISDEPPGCHYLPCLGLPELMLRGSQNSAWASILRCKGQAPGAGFSEGNEQAGCLSPIWVTWHLLRHCWLGWHRELLLWALRTALAQQFLKMLWAADQATCREADHRAIDARARERGGGADEPSPGPTGLTPPQLPL